MSTQNRDGECFEVVGEQTSGDGWEWSAVVGGEQFSAELGADTSIIVVERIAESGERAVQLPFSLRHDQAESTEATISTFDPRVQVAARRALAAFRTSWRTPSPPKRSDTAPVDTPERQDPPATTIEPVDPFAVLRTELERERFRSAALFEALERVTSELELSPRQPRLAANERPDGIARYGESCGHALEILRSERDSAREAADCYRRVLSFLSGKDPKGTSVDEEASTFEDAILSLIGSAVARGHDSGDWRAWAVRVIAGKDDELRASLMGHADYQLRDRVDARLEETILSARERQELQAWIDLAFRLLGEWYSDQTRARLHVENHAVDGIAAEKEVRSRSWLPHGNERGETGILLPLGTRLHRMFETLRPLVADAGSWVALAERFVGIQASGAHLRAELCKYCEQASVLAKENMGWRGLAEQYVGPDPGNSTDQQRATLSRYLDAIARSVEERTAWRAFACDLLVDCDLQSGDQALRDALREAIGTSLAGVSRPGCRTDNSVLDVAIDVLSGEPVALHPPRIERCDRFEVGGSRWHCMDVRWTAGQTGWTRTAYLERLATAKGVGSEPVKEDPGGVRGRVALRGLGG